MLISGSRSWRKTLDTWFGRRTRIDRRRHAAAARRNHRHLSATTEALEDRIMLSVIVWDGEAGDNDWANEANWFDETNDVNNVLPGAGDDVEIRDPFAGTTIQVSSDATVNSLQSAAGVNILSSAAFTLEDTSQIDGPVELAGELLGTGTVTVTESLNWTGGQMGGGGTTVIADGATLTVDTASGVNTKFRSDGRTIDNHGTINWVRGPISASAPLTLHNRPGGVFDIRTNEVLGRSTSGRILINEGTLRKSAGGGRSEVRMELDNTGTVEVETGTLAFVLGGTSSGHISYDAGTTLEFMDTFSVDNASFTFSPSASLIGEGRLLVATRHDVVIEEDVAMDVALAEMTGFGRLRLNRDASIAQVVISGGTLGGTGNVTVTESLDYWTGGSMADGGTTTIAEGATLTIDASHGVSVSGGGMQDGGRTIENFGTIKLLQGGIGASGSRPLSVRNQSSGLFDIRTNSTVGNTGSTFTNAGTLRKSAGGTSNIVMRLDNTGTVEVKSGKLAFNRGGTSTGGFSYEAGTTLEFHSANSTDSFTITLGPNSSLVGEGLLRIARPDVVIEGDGPMDVALVETVGFGRLRLNRDASIPEVLVSGGTLGGTGTLTVTESLDWTGGNMADGGTTTIARGATLTIDAPRNVSVSQGGIGGRTIENFGTIELLQGAIGASGSGPLTIRNQPGALFDIQTDSSPPPRLPAEGAGRTRRSAAPLRSRDMSASCEPATSLSPGR